MHFSPRRCQECGTSFTPRHVAARFCTPVHKERWNRRRRERGAEMYDVVMNEGLKSELAGRLLDAYRTADTKLRDGRKSYQDMSAAVVNIPMAYGPSGDLR